jgi:muramoyltetrapeptide carboxypeptidase
LITPALGVDDPSALKKVEHTIKYFGWRSKLGKNVGKQSPFYDTINKRLDDLHAMFRDPEVDAVFTVMGGYGSSQLLDSIDYDLIRKNPKVFLGYSDITALHLAINKMCNMVTFHGPVAMSVFTSYTAQHFRKALSNVEPIGLVTNPPPGGNTSRPNHKLRAIRPGAATGRLAGGNLALISSLIGTRYEIDTRGAILFLEEINERTYQIDRMLTQLRRAGKFDQAAGIIIGEFVDCDPLDHSWFRSLDEVLDNNLGGLKIPVLCGLTIGHTNDQLTLPLGVMATLNADADTLEITESGVS